ncbi:hypothetical protein PsorP6_004805 [Peronosclerospora sorghi]|uniref:Uncharacterized protein n=1 Tax=Peronosclerospora sorghi TaxID=230839 RepID=A0ACC0VLW8_9STRA|nr:hypothetical protein PsorP6_004805 [Peronosclerospora sorghi]
MKRWKDRKQLELLTSRDHRKINVKVSDDVEQLVRRWEKWTVRWKQSVKTARRNSARFVSLCLTKRAEFRPAVLRLCFQRHVLSTKIFSSCAALNLQTHEWINDKNEVKQCTNTRKTSALASDEASAWRDWQQVYVAWDTHASNAADLFVKGQYNLLKLYHHWFRDVGQAKYPAESFLARIYLGHQPPSPQALGASLLRFTAQKKAEWMAQAAERAEKRCLMHHNWQYYQQLSTDAARSSTDAVV